MLTVKYLRKILDYDAATGVFVWRITKSGCYTGEIAGFYVKKYRYIGIDRHIYQAHNLAWFYVYGIWPKQLDHKNTICDDNRITNLRCATNSQNAANRKIRVDNKSGFKGVSWHKGSNKWSARIGHNGKRRTIGYFKTAELAYSAYINAAIETFGQFARV